MDNSDLYHTLKIARDHPAFAGHFPGAPVLPGVVLLDAALHAVRASGALPGTALRIGSAKFFHPVLPGASLQIRHHPVERGGIEFEIVMGATRVASGTFLPGEEGAG